MHQQSHMSVDPNASTPSQDKKLDFSQADLIIGGLVLFLFCLALGGGRSSSGY